MKNPLYSLAHTIAQSQSMDEEQEAVIRYGMGATFQFFTILVLSMFFGWLTGTVMQSLIIYLAVGTLRRFTGGAHGSSMLQCIIVSVSSILVMALLSRYILAGYLSPVMGTVVCIVFYIISLTIVYLKAPVDSPNKPIKNPEKIKRLRRQSLTFLAAAAAACIVLLSLAIVRDSRYLLSLGFAVCLSLLWQAVNLTPLLAHFNR